MQQIDGELVLSPTDLTKHLGCAHITTLDLLRVAGQATPGVADEALELIFRLGLDHEGSYLETLRAEGLTIATIAAADDLVDRAGRELETLEAMRGGADVVYQATFYDGMWGGQADFLRRVDTPSDLGDWSYDIEDTKLSRKLKVPALLQMATYAERLRVLQGVDPTTVTVVTGDGVPRPWRLVDVAAFARRARSRLREAIERQVQTQPVPVLHCGQCRWIARCSQQWRDEDDLSLVAGMRADHRAMLRSAGITTLAALGRLTAAELPREIAASTRERLVHQASLQLFERETGKIRYDLLPPSDGKGLLALPPADAGDVYLDFEGDQFAEGGEGREYLAGLCLLDGTFTALWAHDRAAEKAMTVELVDLLLQRWREHPDMHVYHYAPYEVTALKRLVARHGVHESQLDQLLRGERFVDLYSVVRQGLRVSKASYSIKKMEAFYWGQIRNDNPDVADALSSVVAYERWSVEPDQQILDSILAYNKDDVLSTRDLHRWLEERRSELEENCGPQLRPDQVPTDPLAPIGPAEEAEIALAARLSEAGEHLLAGLVQFHRREARPAYWELFRLHDLDDEELIEDSAALGSLSAPTTVGRIAKSNLYRYEFPAQDTKLTVGDTAYDVDDRKAAGTVHELDAEAGFVVLRRAAEARQSRGITEKQVLADTKQRACIAEVAQDRLAGRPSLGDALLRRVAPADAHDVLLAGRSLHGQVLAVQGPPGSGKTTTAAALVRALLDDGRTVGITANSHKVLGNLLAKVDRPGVQRCNEPEQFCGGPGLVVADNTAAVVDALNDGCRLVGGTAWMWCEPDLADSVDVLIIEEAGQFSLANAVAVSRAARSMVLLGDPQQLAQPARADHPSGAGASALGHWLDGHDTMPPGRGAFLGTSWRMHPAITDYVSALSYDGLLHSAAGLEHQAIEAGDLSGSGLRVVPVEHEGNAAASREEVAAVVALWHRLVGGTFTDRDRQTRPMTAADVLVVTPYNNQVGLIRAALPHASVGTVDKFQGQEAPVVLYSMTSSSAHDAPRGIDFLYDVHRLNVAVSRAQAMAVVVMSPRLLDADVQTPEQLRRVNALCRLAERATVVRLSIGRLRP